MVHKKPGVYSMAKCWAGWHRWLLFLKDLFDVEVKDDNAQVRSIIVK